MFWRKKPESPKKVSAASFEGPTMQETVESAKILHSDISKSLDSATSNRVAQIISNGIRNKRGLPGISRDIRTEFPTIDKSTSDILAQTETNFTLSLGAMDKMLVMGVDGKRWITCKEPCEICAKNSNNGVTAIGQPFSSGHMQTPAHDGCRCAISPAILNRKD
jgi:hypothetical protein